MRVFTSMKEFIATLIIIIVAIAGIIYFLSRQSGTSKKGPATTITPSTMDHLSIEDYVKANISQLSPIGEEVGGKFYVTAIEAENGKGVVNYEDGHNGHIADFTYTISEEGAPTVTSFRTR